VLVVHEVGLHAPFAVHAEHVPLLQTMLVPQLVPLVTLPAETHFMLPDEHEYVPLTHALYVQAPPAVHDPHCPLRHTAPLPQVVPSVMFVPATHA
jgi:hypothetical protein